MAIAAVAALDPDRPAVISSREKLSYQQLNTLVNQTARLICSAGLGQGDAVALICSNRAEFVVVSFACQRLGVRLTPVNWHLSTEELAYVVDNCEASAVFVDIEACPDAAPALAANSRLRLKVAIGTACDGFRLWPDALAVFSGDDIDGAVLGTTMLYTSGTTGRPKGVLRKQPDPQKAADMQALLTAVFQFQPETGKDCALVTGPLYHAGPFNLCMTTPLSAGIGIVIMAAFTPEAALQKIAEHNISHTFLVPTMMNRLLRLPAELRRKSDLSSLRFVIHGAAPCPVETKHALLEWFGPIIWEMFAGTEGPGTLVSPDEWLEKPGTVGRPGPGQLKILDAGGREVAPGVAGQLYLVNPPESSFEYFREAEKTARAQRDGYFTAGDIGYLDADGYLFLTGRSAEVIISGGVNIYPQEIDDVLLKHNAVDDVACIGVPNQEWGEEVLALVKLLPGCKVSNTMADELLAFCKQRMPSHKRPRRVEFVAEIPRSEAGKISRGVLRKPYWEKHSRAI